jgi:hypothetical protein
LTILVVREFIFLQMVENNTLSFDVWNADVWCGVFAWGGKEARIAIKHRFHAFHLRSYD